jgi:hypothetical protein
LAYSQGLKKEAIRSSETLVDVYMALQEIVLFVLTAVRASNPTYYLLGYNAV